MDEKRKYNLAGIFFLLMFLLAVSRNIIYSQSMNIVWFCDSIPLFLAIGFFLRNNQMIKGMINTNLIFQNVYWVSAVLVLFFGVRSIGFLGLLTSTNFYLFVTFIIHLFSVNVALFLVYRVKPKPTSLFYSFLYIALVLVVTILFTKPVNAVLYPDSNYNFIYSVGGLFGFFGYKSIFFPYSWMAGLFFTSFVGYLIQYFLYRITRKK